MGSTPSEYYRTLFAQVEESIGSLSRVTDTAVIGFSAGGPVSMIQVVGKHAFVTCELSLYEEQVASAEGESYELLCRLPLTKRQVQGLLTAVGAMSMEAQLGHGHTIDISAIDSAPGLSVIALQHFS